MAREASKFWEAMFRESCEQGWPQPYIAIPKVAYKADRKAIVLAAKSNGFSRVVATGDRENVHFCRYV